MEHAVLSVAGNVACATLGQHTQAVDFDSSYGDKDWAAEAAVACWRAYQKLKVTLKGREFSYRWAPQLLEMMSESSQF